MGKADWRMNALAALDDARAEILASDQPMVMTIITVSHAGRAAAFQWQPLDEK